MIRQIEKSIDLIGNRTRDLLACNTVQETNYVIIVVDKVASGQVFSEYFGFSCQNRLLNQFLHPHNHPGQGQ
jgi:hypothetical protein